MTATVTSIASPRPHEYESEERLEKVNRVVDFLREHSGYLAIPETLEELDDDDWLHVAELAEEPKFSQVTIMQIIWTFKHGVERAAA